MAVDIDSIALDVARRFTKGSDPQRRASLQVAVVEAIRTVLTQPAELANQQAPYIGMPVGEKTVARAVASLGQALTFAQDFRAEDVRVVLAALAATGKQQVGEAHSDDVAVDAFAAAMKAKMADARAKGRGGWEDPAQCSSEDLSRMLRDHVEKGDPRDVANFCMMLHQRREAIAARQPGAQVPARLSNDTVDGELSVASAIDQVLELFPSSGRAALQTLAGLFTHPTVYRYAAPPAQGIDLGQFRGWLCATTDGVATDWTMEEDSRARFERMGRTIEPVFAAGPDVQATRQEHLLDRRNRLMATVIARMPLLMRRSPKWTLSWPRSTSAMQRRGWAMAEVAIDITGEEGTPSIVNTVAFDLQLTGCGISIDMTHEQAQAIYLGLAEFFGPEKEPSNG